MSGKQQETARSEGMEAMRDAWDRIAEGYDRYVTPTHLGLSEEALRGVGLREGMRFLDVAAGTGSLSIAAAEIGARVTAVDLSPRMVERLQRRAASEGHEIEARVMDGHALGFDPHTFDVAGSQYGVMLFPDMPRGIRELVRVTRPGGRVVLVVYGPPPEVGFLDLFIEAMRSVDPDFSPPSLDTPGSPFQAAHPEVLRRRLEEAGLEEVEVRSLHEDLLFRSGDGLWDWLMNSNPIPGLLVADKSEEQKAQVRVALDGLLRERADDDHAVVRNRVYVGIGTRP